MAIKLSDPRTFWPVVMVVAVVIAPFFVAIIIAMWSGGRGGQSSVEPLETWSTWSVVDVVGARRSRSRRGRCGRSSISSVVGVSSPDDAVLMLVIGLRRFSEIIEVGAMMLYGGADGAWPKRA